MKLIWLDYLVYSLGNYVIKLCIEADLSIVRKIWVLRNRDMKQIMRKDDVEDGMVRFF